MSNDISRQTLPFSGLQGRKWNRHHVEREQYVRCWHWQRKRHSVLEPRLDNLGHTKARTIIFDKVQRTNEGRAAEYDAAEHGDNMVAFLTESLNIG